MDLSSQHMSELHVRSRSSAWRERSHGDTHHVYCGHARSRGRISIYYLLTLHAPRAGNVETGRIIKAAGVACLVWDGFSTALSAPHVGRTRPNLRTKQTMRGSLGWVHGASAASHRRTRTLRLSHACFRGPRSPIICVENCRRSLNPWSSVTLSLVANDHRNRWPRSMSQWNVLVYCCFKGQKPRKTVKFQRRATDADARGQTPRVPAGRPSKGTALLFYSKQHWPPLPAALLPCCVLPVQHAPCARNLCTH